MDLSLLWNYPRQMVESSDTALNYCETLFIRIAFTSPHPPCMEKHLWSFIGAKREKY